MSQKSKQEQQKEANKLWYKIKHKELTYESVLKELTRKTMESKSQLMSFWSNVKTSNNQSIAVKLPLINEISDEGPEALLTSDEADKIDFVIDKTLATSSKFDIQKSQKSQKKVPIDQPTKSHTPQQEKIQTEIMQLKEQLLTLVNVRRAGLITDELKIKSIFVEKQIKIKQTRLKKMKREAIRQRQRRECLKRTLYDIVDDMPYLKSKLSKFNREKNGRPAVIEAQPDLLNAIVNIASIGAAASDRRRSQELRSCETLDDLNKSLLKLGYCLSRSATYLRLIPKQNTLEGIRSH